MEGSGIPRLPLHRRAEQQDVPEAVPGWPIDIPLSTGGHGGNSAADPLVLGCQIFSANIPVVQ